MPLNASLLRDILSTSKARSPEYRIPKTILLLKFVLGWAVRPRGDKAISSGYRTDPKAYKVDP